ncbi:MAG: hypothetical protein O7G85_17635, partial [Planctomycetota bacterium]|nr:hypothetical protein [Planctomycetota bacterium]
MNIGNMYRRTGTTRNARETRSETLTTAQAGSGGWSLPRKRFFGAVSIVDLLATVLLIVFVSTLWAGAQSCNCSIDCPGINCDCEGACALCEECEGVANGGCESNCPGPEECFPDGITVCNEDFTLPTYNPPAIFSSQCSPNGMGTPPSGTSPVGVSNGQVYLLRGSVIFCTTDLVVPGESISWDYSRSYDSQLSSSIMNDYNGDHWMGGLNGITLRTVNNGDIQIWIDASTMRVFEENAGSYDPPTDYNATLVKSGTGSNEIFTLTEDDTGNIYVFKGLDSAITVNQRGRLNRITNRHLGTSGGITIDSYNSDGNPTAATTTQDYDVTYTYNVTTDMLTKVEVENGTTLIMKAEYGYYQGGTHSTQVGNENDLLKVVISSLNSDGSTWTTRTTMYRYFRNGDSDGYEDHVKGVWDSVAVNAILTAGDTAVDTVDEILTKADTYTVSGTGMTIADFATQWYTYYTSALDTSSSVTTPWGSHNLSTKYGGGDLVEGGFVKTVTQNGSCASCGGGSTGGGTKTTYFYTEIDPQGTTMDEVQFIIIADTEDGAGAEISRELIGLNRWGRELRRALVEDPTESTIKAWCTSTQIGSTYRITETRQPSAHTIVDTEAELKKFMDPKNGLNDSDTVNASDGVIYTYTFNADEYLTDVKVKKGKNGTANYVSATDYGNGTADPSYMVVATYAYPTQTTTRTTSKKTEYDYTYHGTTDNIKTTETTLPAIPVAQNGSNVATTSWRYFDEEGRLRWTKDGEGYVDYYSYLEFNTRTAYVMRDVNTASLDSEITADHTPEWIQWTGSAPSNLTRGKSGETLPTAIELVNKIEFDDQFRTIKTIEPGGAENFIVYDDNMRLYFPKWDDVADEPLLPIQVVETNGGGLVVETYTIDPARTAVTTGLPTGLTSGTDQSHYVTWSKNEYGAFGELDHAEVYHDIPSSGDGTLSTNFIRSISQYDDEGRVEYMILVSTGTSNSTGVEQVTQYIYEFPSRAVETKTGVSSSSHNMGTSYATKPTLNTVSKSEFDDAGVGDGRLTQTQKFHGTGANDYTGENFHFTYRGHLRGIEPFYHSGSAETAIGPYRVNDVD